MCKYFSMRKFTARKYYNPNIQQQGILNNYGPSTRSCWANSVCMEIDQDPIMLLMVPLTEERNPQNICIIRAIGKNQRNVSMGWCVSVHLCLCMETSGRRGIRLHGRHHWAVESEEEKGVSISALYTSMYFDSLKPLYWDKQNILQEGGKSSPVYAWYHRHTAQRH